MGYTTVFEGEFKLNKALDDETYELLHGLARTRRMKRDPLILEQQGYGKAENFGVEGEFYVEAMGQDNHYSCPSIIDGNTPPTTQPGLWLQWVPADDRKHIVWDSREKFYEADKWIIYLIENIFSPRGYLLNGVVNAQGEDEEDQWCITVNESRCRFRKGFSKLAFKPDLELWYEENLERTIKFFKETLGEDEFRIIQKKIDKIS